MTMIDISLKNTKNEILDAYHEVLQQLREAKKVSKQEVKREQEKQDIIKIADGHTVDDIVRNLANLKLSLAKSLEGIESQLVTEHKKLTTLQQAITLQNADLEELYEIKVNADTLAALLQAQKQKKESFEKEMAEKRDNFEQETSQKRALWKQEQDEVSTAWKEQEALQKKLRQREEEEYIYKRDIARQKQRDQYLEENENLEKQLVEKKTLLEKEFSEREAAIVAKEDELQTLRTQIEEFPHKLQQAISNAENNITERLCFKYDHEAKLVQKEVEGERKLHQQMISALEKKISQQEQQIKELTEKSNHAGMQVQEIAVKAIEGASRQRFYSASFPEKSAEVAKA